MYSTKEKLRILRELNNPAAVGADLHLLRTVAPDDPRMVKFDLSPERHAEEILLSLLEHFTREEIVANRRAHFRAKAQDVTETVENVPETAISVPKQGTAASEQEAVPSKKKSAKKKSTRA